MPVGTRARQGALHPKTLLPATPAGSLLFSCWEWHCWDVLSWGDAEPCSWPDPSAVFPTSAYRVQSAGNPAAGLRVEGCHAALPSILLGGFLQNPPFPTVSPLAAVAGPSSQLLPGGSVGQSLAELRVCAVALQSPLLLHRFYEWLSKALTVLS